ncbi:MAG TPA: nuclear transport factor 2 family protein [Myxococcota bacterium]|nr:nuclear transport factor 2 family protein [Myxococcota bacterium]
MSDPHVLPHPGGMRPELDAFAKRYADAWCSGDPRRVASFFSDTGSLAVNDSPPAVGREAIAEVARTFMTAFPRMLVSMDRLISKPHAIEFHWTLTGTNDGPGGTGQRVRISGFEEWRIDASGLIAESKGHFDADDYARQLERGVDG